LGESGPVGLITYMRTDSFTIAREAQQSCRQYIADQIGSEYVPDKPNFFKNRSSAQEAHEAIRPTDVSRAPDAMKAYLDDAQLRLYTLIWKRFVASQMAPADQKITNVDVNKAGTDGKNYIFRASATVTEFPGFTRIYQSAEADDGTVNQVPKILAKLQVGQACRRIELTPEQKFTEPPARFSEATLIRELESNGIGRPSTYAAIVNTIQTREYTEREKGRLVPTDLGFKVYDFLVAHLNELFLVGFTASMESQLDKVEEGQIQWTSMLEEFYQEMTEWLERVKQENSPPEEKVSRLSSLLDSIQEWAPPEKRGRRHFNDQKFYQSLKDNFAKNKILSGRQWDALLKLALKYRDQLPGLEKLAVAEGLKDRMDELTDEKRRLAEAAEKKEMISPEMAQKFDQIFRCFEGTDWEKPVKRGKRTYDDRQFMVSLWEQYKANGSLSEKQAAAVRKLVLRYKERIPRLSELLELLGISQEEINQAKSAAGGKSSAGEKEIKPLLELLAKVENWEEPVKRGRRTFDDRVFFESLQKQFEEKKQLSDRQLGALQKLVKKYS